MIARASVGGMGATGDGAQYVIVPSVPWKIADGSEARWRGRLTLLPAAAAAQVAGVRNRSYDFDSDISDLI